MRPRWMDDDGNDVKVGGVSGATYVGSDLRTVSVDLGVIALLI